MMYAVIIYTWFIMILTPNYSNFITLLLTSVKITHKKFVFSHLIFLQVNAIVKMFVYSKTYS